MFMKVLLSLRAFSSLRGQWVCHLLLWVHVFVYLPIFWYLVTSRFTEVLVKLYCPSYYHIDLMSCRVITFRSSEGSSTVYAMAGREQVFTCETCKRSFGYKHVLQNHERTHTGEKPFHCGLCEKKFTRDHHLKMHMRLHLGQKPYECTECDRKFVQVANLRRHLRVHTGERPYPCELCKSKFSDSNQLKSHMLIHKGEKPFKCIWCQRRFRRRQQLLHHKCSSKKDK